jgi:hypothetical protein
MMATTGLRFSTSVINRASARRSPASMRGTSVVGSLREGDMAACWRRADCTEGRGRVAAAFVVTRRSGEKPGA